MEGLMLKLSLLIVTLCVLHVYGNDEEDEYKRALRAFHLLQREPQQEKEEQRALECKKLGEGCRGLPKCCGTLQCYWPAGFSLKTAGVCVDCVPLDGKCQRNSQCCGASGLQCEKGNVLWLDGNCKPKRTSGHCYQDSQCDTDCNKKWWAFTGECE